MPPTQSDWFLNQDHKKTDKASDYRMIVKKKTTINNESTAWKAEQEAKAISKKQSKKLRIRLGQEESKSYTNRGKPMESDSNSKIACIVRD